jgi:cbb3-type cytochrome oxidase maturation protein
MKQDIKTILIVIGIFIGFFLAAFLLWSLLNN